MSTRRLNIAVVGAGVVGLSTAAELLNLGHAVTVFRISKDKFITSSAAAAFWYPFWVGEKPDHSWYRPEWAYDTFRQLESLSSHSEAGITHRELVEYFPDSLTDKEYNNIVDAMWWRGLPPFNFEFMEFDPPFRLFDSIESRWRFRRGIRFNTLVINMRFYLPFLEKMAGANIEEAEFVHLSDPRLSGFDFTVNCAGIHGPKIASDTGEMFSMRGTVVRLSHSREVDRIVLVHTGKAYDLYPLYVVPRGGPEPDVIVGGTVIKESGSPRYTEWGSLSEEDKGEAEKILEINERLVPAIKACNKLGVAVGYRPRRVPGVRLEPDGATSKIIHNYGHGGGGVSLSWGCAKQVVAWIDSLSDQ